jgi:hypothetical protein
VHAPSSYRHFIVWAKAEHGTGKAEEKRGGSAEKALSFLKYLNGLVG